MDAKCAARRKDGAPCTGRARPSGYCFAHDPDLQDRRAAGKRAGGEHKRTALRLDKLTPATLRPVLTTLLETLAGLKDGSVEPKTGTAMAAVAGAIVRCYETAALEADLQETQRRLDALEQGRPA